MITCANCNRDAIYTYEVTPEFAIHYCQSHLPRFLTAHKAAGLLGLKVPTAPAVEEPVETPAPKTSKKKSADTVAEEEPVVEETPAEE